MIVGAVLIGAVFLSQGVGGTGSSTGNLVTPQYSLPANATQDGQTLGAADAPVTLEIWSDFQCPACGSFARETEPLLWETYVPQGKLKMVYKDAAFQGQRGSDPNYDESVEAAAAARCAGQQGMFWQYADWLFWNQDGENQGAFKKDRLQAIADKVGVDRAAWDACVASGTEQANVRGATTQATQAGVNQTPTLVLNGTTYVGAMPYSQLSKLIDAILATASPAASGASPSASPTGASPSP